MRTINNFYANGMRVFFALARDTTYTYKSNYGNQALHDVPKGYDSMSTTAPPMGPNNYHLKQEIQELASLVEQETNKKILNSWGNIIKSNKYIGGHVHNHNTKVNTVATYFFQAPNNETVTFEDQDLPVSSNMLLIFDAKLLHGIKPIERKSDCILITFELTDR